MSVHHRDDVVTQDSNKNFNDIQQLLKHLPTLKATCELTFLSYTMMKLNHSHEHYLHTWAWTLSLPKIRSINCSCSP